MYIHYYIIIIYIYIICILKDDFSFWLGFHFSDTDWYWALFQYVLIISMSSMKKCLLKLFTHFLNSVICLLLFSSWVVLVSYIFCISDPYSVTQFADTSSHYIGRLLLIVEETILSSLGNFRTLIKIICPHMGMIQWQKKKKKKIQKLITCSLLKLSIYWCYRFWRTYCKIFWWN